MKQSLSKMGEPKKASEAEIFSAISLFNNFGLVNTVLPRAVRKNSIQK